MRRWHRQRQGVIDSGRLLLKRFKVCPSLSFPPVRRFECVRAVLTPGFSFASLLSLKSYFSEFIV